jgi:hypothetical protein
MEARSCTSTSSSCFFPGRKDSKCHHEAIEFACSTCLFCVSCPLSIVWCCIMLPCKIGCKAAGQARKRLTCCRHCGSEKKIYSSFSDIDDSDCRPSHHKHSFGPSRSRMSHKGKANDLQSRRSEKNLKFLFMLPRPACWWSLLQIKLLSHKLWWLFSAYWVLILFRIWFCRMLCLLIDILWLIWMSSEGSASYLAIFFLNLFELSII